MMSGPDCCASNKANTYFSTGSSNAAMLWFPASCIRACCRENRLSVCHRSSIAPWFDGRAGASLPGFYAQEAYDGLHSARQAEAPAKPGYRQLPG